MQQVTTLLTNAFVITMNENFQTFPRGAVAIADDSIVAVGTSDEIEAAYSADEVIDCGGKIVMPGFVNAHTHIPMTLLRGMADDLRLEVWLMGYVMPTEGSFVDEAFCALGTKIAAAEMIRSGTTTLNDMYYFEDTVAESLAETGMRGVLGQTVLMFPSPDSESWEQTLSTTEAFIQKWKDHPLITPAVAPHAPYTCTDEIMQRCSELAIKYDVPLHIHIAETGYEREQSLSEHNTTVMRRVNKVGILDTKCIAAHCVHIDSDEIQLAKIKDIGIAHNPSSNMKLASGLAPVAEMLKHNLKVGIGTDGPASNNDLDMVSEIHIASLMAKVQTGDPTALPAREVLLMATRLGAQALHLGDVTGSLEVAKRADLIVIDDDQLHNTPHFSYDINAVYSRLVYATKSTDILDVMCNGQWLMRDRDLLTIDEAQIRADGQALADKINEYLSHLSEDVFNKLVAIGGVERKESFELQAKARLDHVDELDALLQHPDVEISRIRHYTQYDTYFIFNTERIRYREDHRYDENNALLNVRTRLTYTSQGKERAFGRGALLSRSRFIAPATYPLRFYQEYFQPPQTTEVVKQRTRWRITYKGVQFFVNHDRVTDPASHDNFVEIKSTTWSLSDAEQKAQVLDEIFRDVLKVEDDEIVHEEYVDMVDEHRSQQA